MSFLKDSLDLFLGTRFGHIGVHQYAAHKGSRNGIPTSGASLWAKAEESRLLASGNMLNDEEHLLHQVAANIHTFIPATTTVVDLGPGTVSAFDRKIYPFIQALKSDQYIPVDESVEFLRHISSKASSLNGLDIRPIIDDFFKNEKPYTVEEALVCSFCSTLANLVSPLSPTPPKQALTESLRTFGRAVNSGWLLISFDSDQNGKKIKSYYSDHALFQLNIFDRMAVELPIEGDFDPLNFEYDPLWIASSGQLAHMAVTKKDTCFFIGKQKIVLKKGQRLHLKNSFKFSPSFFERCVSFAGLKVVHSWHNNSSVKVYLLRKTAASDQIPLANAA